MFPARNSSPHNPLTHLPQPSTTFPHRNPTQPKPLQPSVPEKKLKTATSENPGGVGQNTKEEKTQVTYKNIL